MTDQQAGSSNDGLPAINQSDFMRQPVEIQLDILTKLPARQVLNMKQLSTYFQQLIESNEATIAKRLMARRQEEFAAQFKPFEHPQFDSFFDALSYWVNTNDVFAAQWRASLLGFSDYYTETADQEWDRGVAEYAEVLFILHVRMYSLIWRSASTCPAPKVEGLQYNARELQRRLPAWMKVKLGDAPTDDIPRVLNGELVQPNTPVDRVLPTLVPLDLRGEGNISPQQLQHQLLTCSRRCRWNDFNILRPTHDAAEEDILMKEFRLLLPREVKGDPVPGCRAPTGLSPRHAYAVSAADFDDFRTRFAAYRAGGLGELAKAAVIDKMYIL